MNNKFTTIMINKETKEELDYVLSILKKEYPFLNSYNDLIGYLVWYWNKNQKITKNVKS